MRTQALRVTIGAHSNTDWHVSIIEDIYDRGQLVDSHLLFGPIYCGKSQIRWQVRHAVDRAIAMEEERLEAEQGATPGPEGPLLASAQ